jgi:hypothetical protein
MGERRARGAEIPADERAECDDLVGRLVQWSRDVVDSGLVRVVSYDCGGWRVFPHFLLREASVETGEPHGPAFEASVDETLAAARACGGGQEPLS